MSGFKRSRSARVFAFLAIAGTYQTTKATTYWSENPATPDDWFDNFAWSAGIPNSGSSAYIGNGGTATISYGDASAEGIYLGYSAGSSNNNASSGTISMTGGQLYCGNDYIYLAYALNTTASFIQSGGQVNAEYIDIANSSGSFHLN